MYAIRRGVSLRPYNSFGIDGDAAQYVEVHDAAEAETLSINRALPDTKHILGGGSNILITRPIEGLVVRNCIMGITREREDERHVYLRVGAGESWHRLVLYALDEGLGGIENLALIPGCVGASPMQNIGAYGVEVGECIDRVIAWHWGDRQLIELTNAACRFGYRDSIFKQELKGQVLITAVVFKLDKVHNLRLSYGAIGAELEAAGVEEPTIRDVAEAVIKIRRSKLPDPAVVGNAGSFFKNPILDAAAWEAVRDLMPGVSAYPSADGSVKIAAGWLIEQCGFKGYRKGDAGVHPAQALVLVNYGRATGKDILALSEQIMLAVKGKYGIELEREVNIW